MPTEPSNDAEEIPGESRLPSDQSAQALFAAHDRIREISCRK